MTRWEQALLLIIGAMLLLPATASVAFTPLTIMRLYEYRGGGRDLHGGAAGLLFWISLGYIIALGGVRLLHASHRGSWSVPFPRWLQLLTGLVLLLPVVAAAFALAGRGANDEGTIGLVVVAPIFIILGVYNLWLARQPRQ
jgi:hypothetical protein